MESTDPFLAWALKDAGFGSGKTEEVPWAALDCASNAGIVSTTGVCELLFPRLVTYRSGVFRQARFTADNVDQWFEQPGIDVTRVEAVVNHIHLAQDQFPDTTDEQFPLIERLAETLSETWPWWAEHRYGFRIQVRVERYADDIQITLVSNNE